MGWVSGADLPTPPDGHPSEEGIFHRSPFRRVNKGGILTKFVRVRVTSTRLGRLSTESELSGLYAQINQWNRQK
jgi:hypothetical protein